MALDLRTGSIVYFFVALTIGVLNAALRIGPRDSPSFTSWAIRYWFWVLSLALIVVTATMGSRRISVFVSAGPVVVHLYFTSRATAGISGRTFRASREVALALVAIAIGDALVAPDYAGQALTSSVLISVCYFHAALLAVRPVASPWTLRRSIRTHATGPGTPAAPDPHRPRERYRRLVAIALAATAAVWLARSPAARFAVRRAQGTLFP